VCVHILGEVVDACADPTINGVTKKRHVAVRPIAEDLMHTVWEMSRDSLQTGAFLEKRRQFPLNVGKPQPFPRVPDERVLRPVDEIQPAMESLTSGLRNVQVESEHGNVPEQNWVRI